MPRARNIKPGFFANEELAELGPEAMLLFAGLWTLADREGRLEDRPKRIKAQLFPYFDVDVDALLIGLAERGFIDRYTVDGIAYFEIVTFGVHQKPHTREAASTIPTRPSNADSGRGTAKAMLSHDQDDVSAEENRMDTGGGPWPDQGDVEPSPRRPDSLIADSLIADSGLLGGGVDAPAPAAPKPKRASLFAEEWEPTEKDREWARGLGFSDAEIAKHTARCVRHHRGKGNVFKDHSQTWRNWMDRETEYGPARASPSGAARAGSAGYADIGRRIETLRERGRAT